MPANVTYEFAEAQKKYEEAKTDEEKLIALQAMLSTAPTHKGAENLRKDISKKISDFKSKIEKKAKRQKKSGNTLNIKKEGAGQVVILGLPNSGKSTFLSSFTNSKPLIAPYPYSTTKPEIGALNYGGAMIQLVEVPAFLESKEMSGQMFSIIRCADAIVFVVRDYAAITELDKLIALLEAQDIFVTRKKPNITLSKSQYPGVTFVNEQNLLAPKEQAIALLRDSGFRNITLILGQKTDLPTLLLLLNPRAVFLPATSVVMPFSGYKKYPEEYKGIRLFQLANGKDITESIFKMVNKIVVYTKKPGQKVADLSDPLVLEKGATVKDAARQIHKGISSELKSAKVWGSTRFPGQNVSKEYVLQDRDIVEFSV